MEMCRLVVRAQNGEVRAQSGWSELAVLVYEEAYQPGDALVVQAQKPGQFWQVQLDDAVPPALVYLAGTEMCLPVPFESQRLAYSPKAFAGARHLLCARQADAAMALARRNLALNPCDATGAAGSYPHATANIETRGEAVFAARNTIDGVYANHSHGEWPFQSWGINRNPDAQLTVHLGLPCLVDEVRLTLRADFPHDNYWVQAGLDFSDGSSETVALVKSPLPQVLRFGEKRIEWATLGRLIPSEEPSPFPALTQIELWGRPAPL